MEMLWPLLYLQILFFKQDGRIRIHFELFFFFLSAQLNILSFVAELLEWFEIKKPDFVHPIQAIDLTGEFWAVGHAFKSGVMLA